jgi:hypothetical protein
MLRRDKEQVAMMSDSRFGFSCGSGTVLPSDKLTVSGTHWLMPNAGTLAKDGNGYAFSPEDGV